MNMNRFDILLERLRPFEIQFIERINKYKNHQDVILNIQSEERNKCYAELNTKHFVELAVIIQNLNNKKYGAFIYCLSNLPHPSRHIIHIQNFRELFNEYNNNLVRSGSLYKNLVISEVLFKSSIVNQYGLSELSDDEFNEILEYVDKFVKDEYEHLLHSKDDLCMD